MSDRLAVSAIKAQLIERITSLVQHLLPGARRHGGYWQGPNPRRAKDSRTSFTVWTNGAWKEFDSDEKGDVIDLIAYCRRCTTGEAIVWAKDWLGLWDLSPAERAKLNAKAKAAEAQAADAATAERAAKIRRAHDLWAGSVPISAGGPVDTYLAGRLSPCSLRDVAESERDLRQRLGLAYWGPRQDNRPYSGPAMIAPIRQVDGTVTGVHATFLTLDGRAKAPVPAPKVMLGIKQGGAVRLTRGESGLTWPQLVASGSREDLVITEGIETGLSVAVALPEVRVWAALDLGNIGALPTMPAVRRLIVCTENDVKPAAIEQRERSLDALRGRGFDVVEMAPPWGSDFNDTLRGE